MPFYGRVKDEINSIETRNLNQQKVASATGLTATAKGFAIPDMEQAAKVAGLVNQMDEMQKKYWWLKPSLIHGMAKMGVGKDYKTVRLAAEAGAKVEADSPFGFKEPGEQVKVSAAAGNLAPVPDPQVMSAVEALYQKPDPIGALHLQKMPTGWDYLPDSIKQELQTVQFSEAKPSDVPGYNPNASNRTPLQGAYEIKGVENLSPDAQNALRDAATKAGFSLSGPIQYKPGTDQAIIGSTRNLMVAGNTPVGIEGASTLAGGIPDIGPVIKPVVRTGAMVLDAPIQEMQGVVGDVYAAAHGNLPDNLLESQSDLGVSLGHLFTQGEMGDSGEGYLVDPESPVAQERRRRQLERGNIGGHTITPGRWAADVVFEPDSVPFNVLSGMVDVVAAAKLDPSFIALSKYSELRASEKMFTESGGILGLRRTVDPAAVEKFMLSDDWVKGAKTLAEEDNFLRIHKAFNKKLPVEAGIALRDAKTVDEVNDVIKPLLGTALREKPNLKAIGPLGRHVTAIQGAISGDRLAAVQSQNRIRMMNLMPGEWMDLDDPARAVDQVERTLQNVKAPESMIFDFTDRMAQAPNRMARYAVLDDMLGGDEGIKKMLTDGGMDPAQARRMTTMQANNSRDMRKYFTDEIGNPVSPWGRQVLVGDTLVEAPSPHLLSELTSRMVPLPEARALRRATSKLGKFTAAESKDYKMRLPLATMQNLQDKVWKPAALLRAAWTLRVVGEEQIRMAGAGLDGIFNHPISALAWNIGKKAETNKAFEFLGEQVGKVIKPRGEIDVFGQNMNAIYEHQLAMSHGSAGFLHHPGQVFMGDYDTVIKSAEHMPEYLNGWADELAQLANDPVAVYVAKAANRDEAVEWFVNGPGQKFRKMWISAGYDEAADPEKAAQYIDSVIDRVAIKTGNKPELLDAIKTGKVDGVDLSLMAQGKTQVNPAVRDALRPHLDQGPEVVKTPRLRFEKGDVVWESWDRVVEGMFGTLMSRPSNWLSRSPTFRQRYWQRMEEMMPFMSIDAQQATVRAAEEANLGKGIERIKGMRHSSGELALTDADELAKGYALDETRNLLYDLSERGQFFDATRLLFPFGEAWKEVLTRWSKLMTSRPQNVRRLQQFIEGARGPEFGATVRDLTGSSHRYDPTSGLPVSQGFFYKNDRGEEVFNYPGSEWLTGKFIGVPIPLSGRTAGLNMLGNIFPSLGPVAQIPAAYLLPDKPEYDQIRGLLLPFGNPDDPTSLQGWMPAWVKRIMTPYSGDPDTIRTHANSQMDVARYLASTGDYDLNTPEGISKLMSDAKEKATWFALFRGAMQSFAPSAPGPEWLALDKTGHLSLVAAMAADYRAMQNQDFETAPQKFLERWGTDPALVMQAKTHSVAFGYPTTQDGLDWMRNNPGVEHKYPAIFGYFAPQTGEFNYNAYLRAIDNGAKQPLNLEQFIKLGNATLAGILFDQAKAKMPEKPSDTDRAWLRNVKKALQDEYPGYRESEEGELGMIERATPEGKVAQLKEAVKDPAIKTTQAGQATVLYLQARDKAQGLADKKGLASFNQAKQMKTTRDWLRNIGNALVKEYPEFAPLWEQVFDREMNDDTEETG